MTAGSSHDITIANANGTTYKRGFMLFRQNGKRPYVLADYQTIAPRVLTEGELTQAELPVEVEAIWYQEDWRAGLGGRNHRFDAKKIATGYKVDTSFEGMITLAKDLIASTADTAPTDYKPSGFATVGTEVWAFIGRDVYSWDYTNSQWDKGTQPQNAAKIYRNGVDYDGYTYAPAWSTADDTATTYIYKADADANWTLSTLTPNACKYFAVADDKLWGGNWGGTSKHVVRSSTSAINATGSWAGETEIGQADSEVTALVQDGTTLLVCKTNGVWTLYADGTVENLTPEFESMAHPDNFRGAFNWNGHVLLPLGAGGLMELVGGKLYDISMKLYAPDETWLHGRVVAIHGEPTRLFILVQDNVTSTLYNLLMAEWAEFEGKQDFRWHHVGVVTCTTSTVEEHSALMAEGIPSGATIHRRVWVGCESGGSNLLPRYYPMETDSQVVFTDDDDGYAVTVEDDRNMPQVYKRYDSIDFTTTNLGSGANDHYVEVQYRVDGGSWDWLTGSQATSKLTTSPQTLSFAVGITGKRIELKFLFIEGTATSTAPQINSFRLKCQVRTTAIKSIPISVYLAYGQMLLNGAKGGKPVGDLAQLKTWDASASDVQIVTPDSVTYQCIFVPGTLKITELTKQSRRLPEYRADFLLAEV